MPVGRTTNLKFGERDSTALIALSRSLTLMAISLSGSRSIIYAIAGQYSKYISRELYTKEVYMRDSVNSLNFGLHLFLKPLLSLVCE